MRGFLTPCLEPGCPELVKSGRCARHARERTRELNARRIVPTSHYLTPAWRALRRGVLKRDPICVDCGAAMSREVDHVVAVIDGGADELSNLRGLCKRCHSRRTMRELRDRGAL